MFAKVRLAKAKLSKMFILGATITPNTNTIVVNDRLMFAQPANLRVMA